MGVNIVDNRYTQGEEPTGMFLVEHKASGNLYLVVPNKDDRDYRDWVVIGLKDEVVYSDTVVDDDWVKNVLYNVETGYRVIPNFDIVVGGVRNDYEL